MLKKVKQEDYPYEASIAQYLSSPELAQDHENHCVPIYEVLRVPDEDSMVILVMPMLRDHRNPQYETVGEAVDFFRQVFIVSAY
jgi:hypothetical protein